MTNLGLGSIRRKDVRRWRMVVVLVVISFLLFIIIDKRRQAG